MITIFTPTYNRAHLLDRLYESILRQTNKDFEWVIVDDGSSDGTEEKVNAWIKEKKVNIKYYYQENSGKPTAFNNGVMHANGYLFCCIDSDDYLSDDAVEIINSHIDEIKGSELSGMLALKSDQNGKILGKKFPKDIKIESSFALNDIHNFYGEWVHIYKTELLKKMLYPIIKGEKFITESVLYDRISSTYKALLVNSVINICEYQEDGLSNSIYSCMINNPTGYKIYYAQRIDLTHTFKSRLNYIFRYHAFRSMSNDRENNYTGRYKLLVAMLFCMGCIGKKYYLNKGRMNCD